MKRLFIALLAVFAVACSASTDTAADDGGATAAVDGYREQTAADLEEPLVNCGDVCGDAVGRVLAGLDALVGDTKTEETPFQQRVHPVAFSTYFELKDWYDECAESTAPECVNTAPTVASMKPLREALTG